MKIVFTKGCTANRFTADEDDIADLSKEVVMEMISSILLQREDNIHLQVLKDLLQLVGETECLEPCDTCGDTVQIIKLEI